MSFRHIYADSRTGKMAPLFTGRLCAAIAALIFLPLVAQAQLAPQWTSSVSLGTALAAGLAGLEVDLHIATCSGSALQNVVTCSNRAGVEVNEAVLESIAAAEATLSGDERDLGICLLNIGAHSSDLVVFFESAVAYTASVPIGGSHFTNDLAVGLQMPVADAEHSTTKKAVRSSLARRLRLCRRTATPASARRVDICGARITGLGGYGK